MRRVAVAILLALTVLIAGVSAALADWPVTCVGANDAFEFSAGRYQNVGIYQRVFSDPIQAESACRSDHRGEMQAAFAWVWSDAVVQIPVQEAQPEPDLQIDSSLQYAWDLLVDTDIGELLMKPSVTQTLQVRWGTKVSRAGYEHPAHIIWLNPVLQSERVQFLATVLAHELWHAGSPTPRPYTYEVCLEEETLAYVAGALAWEELYPGSEVTSREIARTEDWQFLQLDLQLNRTSGSTSWRFPNLYHSVLYDYSYVTYC